METRRIPHGADTLMVRTLGAGPPLLFVHGWPLHGLTFRHLARRLADRFTCHLLDLPGAGESTWSAETDFSVTGMARAVRAVADGLGLTRYAMVAQDLGGTVARVAAADDPRVAGIVLGNTEMPGHRPPWVPLYVRMAKLPGSTWLFHQLLKSRAFRRSRMGYGNCFADKALLDGEFHDLFVAPAIASRRVLAGLLGPVKVFDWSVVDGLTETHRRIAAPIRLIWGVDDVFFPIGHAREMAAALPNPGGLVELPGGKLFVHDEQADAFAEAAAPFLSSLWERAAQRSA